VVKTEKPNSLVFNTLHHIGSTVGGAVVHHDQRKAPLRLGEHGGDRPFHKRLFIE
jgi:hypothetical protein